MKYCTRCITPDTRPGIILDEDGVCQGCKYFESLLSIDWKSREKELIEIVDWAKSNSSMGYDCIVSVSGGKDSTRQALYIRDNLKMNPLLVSTLTPPDMVTEIGIGNLENLTKLGFDTISVTPDPITYKQLMKKGFYEYGNYNKSVETVLYASAHKVATFYKIPLIVLGENGSIVYGDSASVKDGGNAKNLRNLNTIKDGLDWMVDKEFNISKQDLIAYDIPSSSEDSLKAIYLGYYIKDFSQLVNGLFSMVFGLKGRSFPVKDYGSLYSFSQLDNEFGQVNQMIKYFKFGLGKANEEISELIRMGVMTKETAIVLAKELDGKCHSRYVEQFCSYIDISEDEFWEIAESYRDKNIWIKNKDGAWILRNSLSDEFEKVKGNI